MSTKTWMWDITCSVIVLCLLAIVISCLSFDDVFYGTMGDKNDKFQQFQFYLTPYVTNNDHLFICEKIPVMLISVSPFCISD